MFLSFENALTFGNDKFRGVWYVGITAQVLTIISLLPLVARGLFHKERFWHITVASSSCPSN